MLALSASFRVVLVVCVECVGGLLRMGFYASRLIGIEICWESCRLDLEVV